MKTARTKAGNAVTDFRTIEGTPFKRWYLLANRTSAAIYQAQHGRSCDLVLRLSNPLGRLKEGELDSDRPGRSYSSASTSVRHGLDARNHKHTQVAITFAKRIAKALSSATGKGVSEIILVAEPHFLGMIRAELSAPLRRLVREQVAREYLGGVGNLGSTDEEICQQVDQALKAG